MGPQIPQPRLPKSRVITACLGDHEGPLPFSKSQPRGSSLNPTPFSAESSSSCGMESTSLVRAHAALPGQAPPTPHSALAAQGGGRAARPQGCQFPHPHPCRGATAHWVSLYPRWPAPCWTEASVPSCQAPDPEGSSPGLGGCGSPGAWQGGGQFLLS